ncbi:hypothetical protein HUU42_11920 [bacterium]|nr:hypothetical protein [bacterium]
MKNVIPFVLSFITIVGAQAYAQFSPGELAQPHAYLEGIDHCTQCHDLGKKIDNAKCIDCHTLIKSRLEKKTGYHASADVRGKLCYECHHDHNGREFVMVEWKPSKEKFNHELTGYKLEGKHKTDKCEVCHQPGFINDQAVIQRVQDGLNLNQTFLGLSQDCRSCHFDEHRGQFDHCSGCHDFQDWKQSSSAKFDHQKTRYALTGKHASVQCTKCHAAVNDAKKKPDGKTDVDYFKYKPLNFSNCSPCHADPHQNKFGQNCASCHETTDWRNIRHQSFDHSLTRYPLVGKHTTVACHRCHQPDPKKPPVYKNMKFAECADCHADAHAGQLAARTDKGKCESCHDAFGFRPSLFTVARHTTESRYSLTGAHEKTECIKCHVKLPPKEFKNRTGFKTAADSNFIVLKFSDQRCSACHKDVHHGQFAEKLKNNDCDICHKTSSWKDLIFDHAKNSQFPLLGKHHNVACEKCHPTVDTEFKRVLYKPISRFCEHCHIDIHEGQLSHHAEATPDHPKTYCEKCHTNKTFKRTIFDHNVQSRYALTGAHQKVACNKCHIQTKIKTDTLNTLYKPISTECAACHPDQHEGVFELK